MDDIENIPAFQNDGISPPIVDPAMMPIQINVFVFMIERYDYITAAYQWRESLREMSHFIFRDS